MRRFTPRWPLIAYFWYRNKRKTRNATNAWWYLALALGTLSIAPAILLLIAGVMHVLTEQGVIGA
jgi:hypothetical protein